MKCCLLAINHAVFSHAPAISLAFLAQDTQKKYEEKMTCFGGTEMLESPLAHGVACSCTFSSSKEPGNNCRNLHNKALPQVCLAGSWLLCVRRDCDTADYTNR